jgi:predicted TIM-barrel fold metal-dependent hydrolase
MQMNDMVIISVDDHISEPPDMFRNHLSGAALESAPRLEQDRNGKDVWVYQGMKFPSVGLNAVVGRPFEEYGMEPTALEQLREGCYDVHERIKDMDVNGIAASLNFGSVFDFAGGRLSKVPDRDLARVHLRAYNDWHVDEWCAAYPGRFIPCGILPCWDMDATVAEIRRLADKGCHTVSINENPTAIGLPSIHNDYWKPFFKAIADNDTTICLHIGGGNPAPHASIETPIEAWITTMPMTIATGASDWLQLEALQEYPSLRIALSEGGIGWVPYFLERADFSNARHKAWTNSRFPGDMKPSDTFKRHFLNCFIDDAFGLQNIRFIGEDNIAYECDYPHSDTLWPEVPERLWPTINHLTDAQIDKITHGNAMKWFRFDPFEHYARADLTVGALREKARAANVDTAPKSSAGARPVEEGVKRPITSGDLMRMFAQHANEEMQKTSAQADA